MGDSSAVLHRTLHSDPLRVVAAKGHHLQLSCGRKILDATGGAAVSCLGHGNARVRAAVAEQMETVAYCHSAFYGTDTAEELATLLCSTTGGAMTRALFLSSGSEAMEAALKMARQYYLEKEKPEPARTRFIARWESYHGNTLGALGVGGHRGRRKPFEPVLAKNSSWVSPCNAYRGKSEGELDEAYVARLATELDEEFQRVGPETVCAFIAEPVVGAALGCVPSVPGYFKAVRAVCDKYGALLILDEVMSGMGRTGTVHAWQSPDVGVSPDLQTLGKCLGGGALPIAAMLVSKKVVTALQKGSGAFVHGQTYQGHPVACRAALETLRIVLEDKLTENVAKQGEYLGQLLREKLLSHPHVGDVRGKGLFWGVEIVQDKDTKTTFPVSKGVAAGLGVLGLSEPYNISIYPGTGTVDGFAGDHFLISPAYDVTKEEIEEIADRVTRVVEDYFAKASHV